MDKTMKDDRPKIHFKAKIRRTGTSHVITIPSDYIKHGMLWEDDEWEVYIPIR